MKATARAVIIGGGGVGASVLYHLAKIGWTDVLLLEKSELTAGSTWDAAGGMHTFNGEANISRLQKYTIDLYREIEALSGQSCSLHPNGGLMLAATQGELDSLKLIFSRLQKYTIDLYREIEALSGQSCSLHPNGGLMLAATQGELDSLKLICSRARYLGMETEMISLAQALEFNPLIAPSPFTGALGRPDGGHCDPSG